jgi:hypothetical protein
MGSRLHFVPCDWRGEVCKECGNAIPVDALMMVRWGREPHMGRMVQRRAVLCEPCGRLMIESEDHPIDKAERAHA